MSDRAKPISFERVEQHAEQLVDFIDLEKLPEEQRLLFAYYHLQAPPNSVPEWTWGYFDRGIAKYGTYSGFSEEKRMDLDKVDALGQLLIPNFTKRQNGLSPVLDVYKPLADDMTEKLATGSLIATANHPSLVTPIIMARSLVEALRPNIPDIQKRLTITYGLLPTVFEYDFREFGIDGIDTVSPVGIATAIGNTAITAAVSDSNLQPELKEQQVVVRHLYKANIEYLLSTPGNIVVVILNGQRDVSFSSFNKRARRINHPEGDLDVFDSRLANLVNAAIYDTLLTDPGNISSPVQFIPEMRLRPVTKEVLESAHEFQAKALMPETFDGTQYSYEWLGDMKLRIDGRRRAIEEYIAERRLK